MPWKTDENGEKHYELSPFTKEELPTWNEIYNDFYKGKVFTYNPNNPDDQELDPYWKIPRKKFLISTICNQFNKMILEDDGKILHQFMGISDKMNVTSIEIDGWIATEDQKDANTILTIPFPNGEPNPFIFTSQWNRIDVSQINGPMSLSMVLVLDDVRTVITPDHEFYDDILEIMMKPFKEYFENGIGWKDSDGNVIESEPSNNSEMDPAL